MINAYASHEPKAAREPFQDDPGEPNASEVAIGCADINSPIMRLRCGKVRDGVVRCR